MREPELDNVVVVTGTDTEIGKTTVAAGVIRALTRQGHEVRAIKPVESGLDRLQPHERDSTILADASGQSEPADAFVQLGPPLAPPEAADIEGVALDMDAWIERIRAIAQQADWVIVEGAGGLLSPLTWSTNTLDLARRLNARALVVAPNQLGVLNHTLLTLRALRDESIPLSGIVFNATTDSPEDDPSIPKNVDTLREVSGIDRVVGCPRVDDWPETVDSLQVVTEWITQPATGPNG
jgi:dethiobiotin synthase